MTSCQRWETSQNDERGVMTHQERQGSSVGRRASWTILDQALSSAATAILSIAVASSVSAREYGSFALALSLFVLFVAASQALNGQVLAIRYPGLGGRRNPVNASAAGGAVLGGAVLGTCLLVASASATTSVRPVLLVLAIFLPALLLQDYWRSAFVSGGRPAHAFANDAIWVLIQVGLVTWLLLEGVEEAFWFVGVWAIGGLVAATLGIRQSQSLPSLTTGRRWLSSHSSTSLPLVGVALTMTGAGQVGLLLVGLVGSVEDVGGMRAVQTLLGPLNIIGFGLASFAVPEVARRGLNSRALWQSALGLSALFGAVTLGWSLVLVLLPDALGERVLGETWKQAEKAVPGLVVSMLLVALAIGPSVVVRALDRTSLLFACSVFLGVLLLVLPPVAMSLYGLEGAAWANAAASALALIPFWWAARAAIRRGKPVASVAPLVSLGPAPNSWD